MAKEKKEELVDKKKKLSYETEVALLGLMLAIVSLIGLLNQGYFGSLITYLLVFVFGSWYYAVLVALIYIGGFLFIKRKKPKFVSTLTTISFVLLVGFLAIASSKYEGASLSNWYTYYKAAFDRCSEGIHISVSNINQVGGGIVGYSMYALLVTALGEFMSNVIIVVLVMAFAYLAFKKPLTFLYEKFMKYSEILTERKKEKKKTSNVKPEKVQIESKDDSKKEKKEQTHFLTYDIFTEKIFDEEEVTIEMTNPFQENNKYINENIATTSTNESVNEEVIDDNEQTLNIQEEVNPITSEVDDVYNDLYDYDNQELENFTIKEKVSTVIENSGFENIVREEKIISEPEIIKTEPISYEDEIVSKDTVVTIESTPIEQVSSEPYMMDNNIKETVGDLYSLLVDNVASNASEELKDEVETNCTRINQKLEELNIKARVSNYIIGPCVTRYEIVPEIGVRVSSIVNIQNDLKLALAAVNLRMEAPIPGKSAVGIEVANKKRYPVFLKEVLETKIDNDDKLLVAIGKDLNNSPVTISIDKMPHLLIAGATGSGKSVCINAIIMSLILRATPDEVKMILVDPKKVEMLPYANMPHLLCPVVTDPKKASNALKKVVVEMDKRYDLFANNGVRNIDAYNKLEGKERLYKLVVIIDELADLMLVASKEVEESIQRITQLARAAGIYLIVATQRPSVDVITGVIKANIPSRIAFSVSSMVDSRTILDRAGAEDLLGKGDMLMDISGSGSLNRVQGVLVSDEEIEKVVEQVKLKYDVEFKEEFLNLEDDKKEIINNLSELGDNNGEDDLYNDIKTFVIQNQRASTSLLQRYFSLGYARAARMMDRLEQDGIVSASNGIKPREILVKEDDLNNGSSNE